MSYTEHEQTQTQQAQPDPAKGDTLETYPISLVKRYTGATHYVEGGSRTDLVRHAETGEPEQEYALVAAIDGVDVVLSSWNAGRIDTRVVNAQAAQQQQQQV